MATVNLSPTKDASIRGFDPTSNLSTDVSLHIGRYGNDPARFLMAFDFSTIPSGSTINSASLRLNCADAGGIGATAIMVYRCRRVWVNGEVTWNIYSTGNSWTTAGCSDTTNDRQATEIVSFTHPTATGNFTVASGWDTAQLAALFGANDTIGFLVKHDTESGTFNAAQYRSQDWSTAGERPLFTIDYTAPAAGKAPPPRRSPLRVWTRPTRW